MKGPIQQQGVSWDKSVGTVTRQPCQWWLAFRKAGTKKWLVLYTVANGVAAPPHPYDVLVDCGLNAAAVINGNNPWYCKHCKPPLN